MSAQAHAQAGLLVRLREVRLTRANRELTEARAAAARAEAEARLAEAEALGAEQRLDDHRVTITARLDAAPTRLALIDHARFLHAIARTTADEAEEQRRLCDEAEREQRRAMILARARRDVVVDHARGLALTLAATREEHVALEIEEGRRA